MVHRTFALALVCMGLLSTLMTGCASTAGSTFRLVSPAAASCIEQLPAQGWEVVQDAPPTRLLSKQQGLSVVFVLVYASPLGPLVGFAEAAVSGASGPAPTDVDECLSR